MIKLSNTAAQIVQPGQALTFNNIISKSGCGECHRNGSNSIKLCSKGTYEFSVSVNIDGATASAPVQLSVALGGEVLPETTMISSVTGVNHVGMSSAVKICCCDYNRITVINSGTIPVTVSENPLLYVRRVG